jgi:hypothetical protein
LIWLGAKGDFLALVENKVQSIDDFFNLILVKNKENSGIAPGLKADLYNTFKLHIGEKCLKIIPSRLWLQDSLLKILSSEDYLL